MPLEAVEPGRMTAPAVAVRRPFDDEEGREFSGEAAP